jgi:hypothetical protein
MAEDKLIVLDRPEDQPDKPVERELAKDTTRRGSLKDAVTLALSILAFLISGISAYVNVISQVDDIRVVVDQVPSIDVDIIDNPPRLGLVIDSSKELRLLFINAGNRQAAIRAMRLRVLASADCLKGVELILVQSSDVIKEKSTLIVRTKIVGKAIFDDPISQEGQFLSMPLEGKNVNVRVCAHVGLATPSTGYAFKDFEILRVSNDVKRRWNASEDKKAPPVVVHKNKGTIFGD